MVNGYIVNGESSYMVNGAIATEVISEGRTQMTKPPEPGRKPWLKHQ